MLTHFHADHVDGLAGVVDGRRVGAVLTTRVLDPPGGAEEVAALARAHGLATGPASYAATATYGAVTLQVLWPRPGPVEEGSRRRLRGQRRQRGRCWPRWAGLRILLTGDVEPPGQAALARTLPGLDVDVLKVPHHGSRYRTSTGSSRCDAEVALVSVGADNDYGHPAPPVARRPDRERRGGLPHRPRPATCGRGPRTAMRRRSAPEATTEAVGALWEGSGMRAGDVLGRVTLVTGKEEFLNERTVAAVREAVLGHDAEAEISETDGRRAHAATAWASWPRRRCSPRSGASWCGRSRTCPRSPSTACSPTPPHPSDDVALVLVHGGGPKGSGVLTKLRKLPAVSESKSAELKPSEIPGFVDRRGPPPRRHDRPARPRPRWSRRSARTCGRCPRPRTSWPATSRASRSRWSR